MFVIERGDDPARRPRRLLRVGRAARRPPPARPARSSSAAASCSRPATRPRPTASARRWAGAQARRLCPQAVVVEPRMSAYSEASKAVFEVFEDTTPLVEGLSIDEAFLDVGGLRRISGTPTEIAARLRRDVRERVGLPITVGVARTKFLAKVASGVAKPDGLLVVPPDGELAFLHPLPVERLWGVGPVTAAKLHDRGHHDRRRGGPRSPRRRSSSMLGRGVGPPPPRPRPQPRSPAGAGRPPAAARSDRSAPSAGRRDRPTAVDAVVVGARRPRHPPDAGRRAGSAAPSCSACASTTSPGRPARTRCPRPTAQTQTILADGAGAAGRRPCR